MQQMKVVPAISAAWAHLITSVKMQGLYDLYTLELNQNSHKGAKAFDMLQELHCVAAGLKPMGTWHGEYFGELLKQSCGGHGYLQINGLTRPHTDVGFGITTAEGDNHVLLQQTSMILLKKVQSGQINLDQFQFNISTGELGVDEQIVLLYEIRYKGELRAAAAKVQVLVS
jgi:acyl-CoA oxidase